MKSKFQPLEPDSNDPKRDGPTGPSSPIAGRDNLLRNPDKPKAKKPKPKGATIMGKPILYRKAITIINLNNGTFHEKLLCDGLIFNCGDACGFSCTYCFTKGQMLKIDKQIIDAYNAANGTSYEFQDVVIRRLQVLEIMRSQLIDENGQPRYNDPNDTRVIYTSTIVDPAASPELLEETANACILILENTHWQIRILSKSKRLENLIFKELIPKKYHHRLILGYSLGTLDDEVARKIEVGTSPPSDRIKSLHRLQDAGYRTFGMICPSLPQEDYVASSKALCDAIRVDRCEQVWTEVMNVRADAKQRTVEALRDAGREKELALFTKVFGDIQADGNVGATNIVEWEKYARATFEAHCQHIPANKHRFLQYVEEDTVDWWAARRDKGAVPIGKVAILHGVTVSALSAPMVVIPELDATDIQYRDELYAILTTREKSEMAAAKAIYLMDTYKEGLLWKKDFPKFTQYLESAHGYEKSQGYRMRTAGSFIAQIEADHAAEVAKNPDLASTSPVLPTKETHSRAVTDNVPAEHRVACWKSIVEELQGKKPKAELIERLALKYVRKNKLTMPKEPKAKPAEKDAIVEFKEILKKLKAKAAALSNPTDFEPLFVDIECMLTRSAKPATDDTAPEETDEVETTDKTEEERNDAPHGSSELTPPTGEEKGEENAGGSEPA